MQRTLTLWARPNPAFTASSPQLYEVIPLLLCNFFLFPVPVSTPALLLCARAFAHFSAPPAHLFPSIWEAKSPEVERENAWKERTGGTRLENNQEICRNPFHDKGTKVPGKTDWKDVMMQRMCGESGCESLHLQKHCSVLEPMGV